MAPRCLLMEPAKDARRGEALQRAAEEILNSGRWERQAGFRAAEVEGNDLHPQDLAASRPAQ